MSSLTRKSNHSMVQESAWLNQPRTANHLSDALWMRVFASVAPEDRKRLRAVCRRFRAVDSALRAQGKASPFRSSFLSVFLFLCLMGEVGWGVAASRKARLNALLAEDPTLLNAVLKERGLMAVPIESAKQSAAPPPAEEIKPAAAVDSKGQKSASTSTIPKSAEPESGSKWKFTLRKTKK